MKKSVIAKIVYIIFIVFIVLGGCCLFAIPKLYDIFKSPNVALFMEHSLIYKVAFYMCYIIVLGIIYELIGLFNQVYKGSPFNKKVEKSLKVSAVLFMLLFVIIIIKAIFISTLLSFAIAIVCFIASLSFYVLAEVIKAAIIYKDEIDYTV